MRGMIISEDVAKVQCLMEQVLGTREYRSLSRLGGLSNHTYKVVLHDGEEYVFRIPGEGTEELINRRDEIVSTKLACQLGIDAPLLYFSVDGTKVSKYIPQAVTMSASLLKERENIRLVAQTLRKIHSCGVDTKVPFEVFDMARDYERVIFDKDVPMFEDYEQVKAEVAAVKAEIDETATVKKVPCHNDPLCENWVKSGDRMYLIDWEYAGMNDGMWDLADVSIEAGYDADCDMQLLRAYMEREPDLFDAKHFLASKIYVDYLWTLWAKARVPYDGQSMEDWAVERYTRMKLFLAAYRNLK